VTHGLAKTGKRLRLAGVIVFGIGLAIFFGTTILGSLYFTVQEARGDIPRGESLDPLIAVSASGFIAIPISLFLLGIGFAISMIAWLGRPSDGDGGV
jgi:hypothetical protein